MIRRGPANGGAFCYPVKERSLSSDLILDHRKDLLGAEPSHRIRVRLLEIRGRPD